MVTGTFKSPIGLAVDSNGNILVCDSGNGRIQMIDPDGAVLRVFGSKLTGSSFPLIHPWGIALDRQDKLVVCDTDGHRIQVFSNEGELLMKWGQDMCCMTPTIDRNGTIYVTDTKNRIQMYAPLDKN